MVIIMVKTGKVTESVDLLNGRNVHTTYTVASSDKLETASAASVAMNGS